MAGFKKKLAILAVVGVLLAISFPFIKKKYRKHVKPHVDIVATVCKTIANFNILGYHIPWKYVLPVIGLIAAIQIWRRRRRKRKEAEELAQRKFMTEAEDSKPAVNNVVKPPEILSPAPDPPLPPKIERQPESVQTEPAPSSKPQVEKVTQLKNPRDMTSLSNRLRTFCFWPATSSANVFELARAGFLFTGRDDVVKCFICKGNLKEWKQDDNPLESHREFYPDCPYIKELEEANTIFDTKVRLADLSTVTEVCADRLKHLQSVQNRAKSAPAQKHLSELNKRLDTTERTMHLVMKQMEAVTKCLAKTLADDPALSEDKTLAEMTQGLVNLKESNV